MDPSEILKRFLAYITSINELKNHFRELHLFFNFWAPTKTVYF